MVNASISQEKRPSLAASAAPAATGTTDAVSAQRRNTPIHGLTADASERKTVGDRGYASRVRGLCGVRSRERGRPRPQKIER
jgi:hypothetical protein